MHSLKRKFGASYVHEIFSMVINLILLANSSETSKNSFLKFKLYEKFNIFPLQ